MEMSILVRSTKQQLVIVFSSPDVKLAYYIEKKNDRFWPG